MPRAKNEKVEVALNLYRQGILLKDIAAQLDVPAGTVRRWKSTYKWDNERSKKESERSQKKKDVVKKDVESVISNPDLTEKQRLFCLYYVRCFNATKAAIKAGYSKGTAMEQGYQLLQKTPVRDEIARLKQVRMNRELLDEHDIFQKYMDIAFSDITDYLEFGTEEVPVMGAFGVLEDKETGEPLTKVVNVIKFKSSAEVDGTLISEVKQGRDGASIKLADRMKALDWLANHMDLATEEQKARIAALRVKSTADEPEEVDTSYVDTLKELAAKVWDEEEKS